MLSRRSFLAGGMALGAVRSGLAQTARPRFQTSPFTLGVASGDPAPDGAVLWTRLAPDPLTGGGMPPAAVDVAWEVARDDRMRQIVRRGTAVARHELAHSVHVEVDGLQENRPYWYRFHAGGVASPIGRTRTLPSAGAAVDRLRFAFASCQHFEFGYFTAYDHLAAEDLDLVFHLGDYIYEGSRRPDPEIPRQHLDPEAATLDQYRRRYAQYRLDPALQAAHAACPWVVTWDDHEVENNYAGALSSRVVPAGQFLDRRAAAYQAYYEHMPLRRTALPDGPSARLYRRFAYGSLGTFFVLDTRQYRTDQPCGDGLAAPCGEMFDPAATMMGAPQRAWLLEGLDRSRARWNIIPQQVMMAGVDFSRDAGRRLSMDHWSGYQVERTRFLQFLADRRPGNPVVLTGDVHNHWVNDLKVDFDDPKSPIVGTEFVGTSISSGGDGEDRPAAMEPVLARNAFVRFFNSQRGYVSCELTSSLLRAELRVLDYVSRPGAPRRTRAVFVVEDGRCGAQRA
ncbi:MAG: alkaline phosphatase D family protein [Acidobacteriota bacterium]